MCMCAYWLSILTNFRFILYFWKRSDNDWLSFRALNCSSLCNILVGFLNNRLTFSSNTSNFQFKPKTRLIIILGEFYKNLFYSTHKIISTVRRLCVIPIKNNCVTNKLVLFYIKELFYAFFIINYLIINLFIKDVFDSSFLFFGPLHWR